MTNIDSIISPAKYHRSLNGFSLTRARQELGMTQQQLADKISRHRTYIVQLEHYEESEVRVEIAEAIVKVLAEWKGKNDKSM